MILCRKRLLVPGINKLTCYCISCLKSENWNLSIHSTFIEHLLGTQPCCRHWDSSSEQTGDSPCSPRAHVPVEEIGSKQVNKYVISVMEKIEQGMREKDGDRVGLRFSV